MDTKKTIEEIIDDIFNEGLENETYYDEEVSKENVFEDIIDDYFAMHDGDQVLRRDEALYDEYIEETLKKYNYDYKRLIKRLVFYLPKDKIDEALMECNISYEEYNNPTKEVFDTLRDYVINGKRKQK